MQIISPIQEKILKIFARALDSEQFYLTGWTALAYFYLRHRQSNDLDFFTPVPELVAPFSRNLEKVLIEEKMTIERRRAARSFIELGVKSGGEFTLLQLAQDSPFRFEPPREFPEFSGLKVDSLRDIASNKLLALFGRAMLRDFIDVYMLARKAQFVPEMLMKEAAQKDAGFDLYWLAVAFERIHTFQQNSPEMLMLCEPVAFGQLVEFFDQWRKKIAQELKSPKKI